MLKETPFHERLAPLCLSHAWRHWAGYRVASQYDLIHDYEYHAIRNTAALIDVTPLFKYLIKGKDAERLVNRVVTRDAGKLSPGRAGYTTWCDSYGKTLDDGVVARMTQESFHVTSAEPNLVWFERNALGLDVTITDVSQHEATLAIQGPLSYQILQDATEGALSGLRYFGVTTRAQIAKCPVMISRTGYTGDLGYEVWIQTPDAITVFDELMRIGTPYGMLPAGMIALDMSRVEAGLILLDVDYTSARHAMIEDQKSSPFELGLGWSVHLDKEGYFVGRDALEKEVSHGSKWNIVGLEIQWDSIEKAFDKVGLPPMVPHTTWRASTPIYAMGVREAGYATSGCFSPLLKRYIVLATLHTEFTELGTNLEMEITVEHQRRRAKATVVKTPFFDPKRKRAVLRG